MVWIIRGESTPMYAVDSTNETPSSWSKYPQFRSIVICRARNLTGGEFTELFLFIGFPVVSTGCYGTSTGAGARTGSS